MATPTPSCSILVVSSNFENSKELVTRLIALAPSNNTTADSETSTKATGHIPWTISNEYYTAPVYFLLKSTQEVFSGTDVPAFIFVFDPTVEDCQVIFADLLPSLKDSDFEVSLAVSMSKGDANEPTEEQQRFYDSFFGSFGLEYINGQTLDNRSLSQYDTRTSDDIPGLGRIIDSLSTILWPSMIRKTRHMKTRSIIHIPNEEEGLRSLLAGDSDRPTLSTRAQEMTALENWLEEAIIDSGYTTPRRAQPPSSTSEGCSTTKQAGFDDNFSDFVSAPSSIQTTDDDSQLPSRQEVAETMRRIMELKNHDLNHDHDDGDDIGYYDISHVLAGLEVMKTEIAGIQDEQERRRAAAKVALSLAHGFENTAYNFDDSD